MTDREWIYYFNDKGEIIRNKEILNIFPRLAKLSDEEFKYYVLVYDHVRSPYKFRPRKEVQIMAARLAFKKDEIVEEDKKVVIALRSMLYDEKHETVIALRTKINALNDEILAEEDNKKLTVTMTTIDRLQSMLDKVMEQIKEKSDTVNIGKGKKLSLLEELQRNRKLYEMKAK